MKPLHPHLQKTFRLAQSEDIPEEPPAFLEDRLMARWRDSAAEVIQPYRAALACACAIVVVSGCLAYHSLASLPDPAVAVANSAVRSLLPL